MPKKAGFRHPLGPRHSEATFLGTRKDMNGIIEAVNKVARNLDQLT